MAVRHGIPHLAPQLAFLCLALVAATVVTSFSCSNDGASLVAEILGDEEITLADDIQPVFTARCATSDCHSGLFPAEELSLEEGNLYSGLNGAVSVFSRQAFPMVRIAPGDAENSYLVHKIQGTHLTVGGTGERMPLDDAPLGDSTILAIRKWIDEGALDN